MAGILDAIGKLFRIMNKDANETFDPATASLEALSEAIAAIPPSPSAVIGICSAGMAPSTTEIVCGNLAGIFEDDTFNSRFVLAVLKNANSAGAAPEFELQDITDFEGTPGKFITTAFSADVEEHDIVIIMPYDLASRVVAMGILTTSSATVPADNVRRAADANNYWRGCILMPVAGVCARQPRRLVASATLTGVLTLDPNTPFTAAPGLVPYVILGDQDQMAPAADGTNTYTPADGIGNKASTAIFAASNTADIFRYLKGLMGSRMIASGTLTTSSATQPVDNTRTEGNDHFKDCRLMTLSGSVAFQPRPIARFAAGGTFYLDEPFTAAPGTVAYVILEGDYPVQRLLDIFNAVVAILALNETGGSITTDGTEQDVYINNSPVGSFEPKVVQLDTTNMVAGDTITVREYYRVAPGGNLIKQGEVTFSGAQDPALKTFRLLPNRFGVKVTVQRTAGTDRSYNWEVLYAD